MTTPPTVLGGRYELGEMIGQGGMATVLTGRDMRLGRTVAIKLLRSDLVDDKTFAARFRQEAFAVASLNHPRIVGIYDTGEQQINGLQVPYIVMEHVDGKPLNEIQDPDHRILPERAMEITAEVLDALEYSHRAGIIHRDIKPGNVMVTPGGEVKVMDFGIARAVDSATMTATRTVVGTANYLSPEQARGETVDNRSDVYSTGCLLYELLTGRPPFTADSPIAVIYQHVGEEPRPPGIRPDIDAVVLWALVKDTTARYRSAAQMRSDLLRVLDGQPPVGPSAARNGNTGGRMAAAAGPGGPGDPSATRAVGPAGPPPTGEQPTGNLAAAEQGGLGRRRKAILIGASAAALALIVAGAFALPGLTGDDDPAGRGGTDTSPTPSETVRKNQNNDQNDQSSPKDDGEEDEIEDDWTPSPEDTPDPDPEPTTTPSDDDDSPDPEPTDEPTTPPDDEGSPDPEPTDEPTTPPDDEGSPDPEPTESEG